MSTATPDGPLPTLEVLCTKQGLLKKSTWRIAFSEDKIELAEEGSDRKRAITSPHWARVRFQRASFSSTDDLLIGTVAMDERFAVAPDGRRAIEGWLGTLAARKGKLCGLCDSAFRCSGGWQFGELYGHPVCGQCRKSFDGRRTMAFVVDYVFAFVLALLTLGVIDAVFGPLRGGDEWGFPLAIAGLGSAWLLVRDGFSGFSPGRLLTGLRAIDERTGSGTGFVASIKRNLPVLFQPLVLVIMVQMRNGYRLGDRWAHTRIVWRKYRGTRAFDCTVPTPAGTN